MRSGSHEISAINHEPTTTTKISVSSASVVRQDSPGMILNASSTLYHSPPKPPQQPRRQQENQRRFMSEADYAAARARASADDAAICRLDAMRARGEDETAVVASSPAGRLTLAAKCAQSQHDSSAEHHIHRREASSTKGVATGISFRKSSSRISSGLVHAQSPFFRSTGLLTYERNSFRSGQSFGNLSRHRGSTQRSLSRISPPQNNSESAANHGNKNNVEVNDDHGRVTLRGTESLINGLTNMHTASAALSGSRVRAPTEKAGKREGETRLLVTVESSMVPVLQQPTRSDRPQTKSPKRSHGPTTNSQGVKVLRSSQGRTGLGPTRGLHGIMVRTPTTSTNDEPGEPQGQNRETRTIEKAGREHWAAAEEYNSAIMSPGSDRVIDDHRPAINLSELSAKPVWMEKKQPTPNFRSPVYAVYQRRASMSNDGRIRAGGSPGSLSSPPMAHSSPVVAGRSAEQNRSHLSGVASTLNMASPAVRGSPAVKISTAVKQSMWEVRHRLGSEGDEGCGGDMRNVLSSPTTDSFH